MPIQVMGDACLDDRSKRSSPSTFVCASKASEENLRRNYAEDVVLLCSTGIVRGHEGVRYSARRLRDQLPNAKFEFVTRLVAEGCAFLEWRAESDRFTVTDGADSFVFRDGKIVVQSIHYTLVDERL